MKKIILYCLIAFICISCGSDKKRKKSTNGVYSVEDMKPSFEPVHQYKDKDGNVWSKDNIWAPRENESLKEKIKSEQVYSNDEDDAYKKGYKDGMEQGKQEGYERGYEQGSKDEW